MMKKKREEQKEANFNFKDLEEAAIAGLQSGQALFG